MMASSVSALRPAAQVVMRKAGQRFLSSIRTSHRSSRVVTSLATTATSRTTSCPSTSAKDAPRGKHQALVGIERTPSGVAALPRTNGGASRRAFSSSSADSSLVYTDDRYKSDGVALCVLNRPKALNALSDSLVGALISELKALDGDDSVRCIVLTGHLTLPDGTEVGTPKAFAAGADIKQMNEKTFAEVHKGDMLAFWNGVKEIRKPVIAAVNGFALGGGCELAMACDIIVASEVAKFGQPEIKLGTIPGCGGSQRLTHAVGKSKAMWWMLSGETFSASEAERSGLVAKVFGTNDELLTGAVEMAKKIAAYSSPVLQMVKDVVNQSQNLPLDQGLLFERRVFHSTWGLEDRKEGMTAFAEKRQADFKHQ
ncbi:unnamed protein product [Amoebophrya sp. A25]|nr:unnamed protein product [Amoebophrya sp. A25]|eukprot:GSA25T00008698001.1